MVECTVYCLKSTFLLLYLFIVITASWSRNAVTGHWMIIIVFSSCNYIVYYNHNTLAYMNSQVLTVSYKTAVPMQVLGWGWVCWFTVGQNSWEPVCYFMPCGGLGTMSVHDSVHQLLRCPSVPEDRVQEIKMLISLYCSCLLLLLTGSLQPFFNLFICHFFHIHGFSLWKKKSPSCSLDFSCVDNPAPSLWCLWFFWPRKWVVPLWNMFIRAFVCQIKHQSCTSRTASAQRGWLTDSPFRSCFKFNMSRGVFVDLKILIWQKR